MATIQWTEWHESEPIEDRPMCDIGPMGHQWELSIEEGQICLSIVDKHRCQLYQSLTDSGNEYYDCEEMLMVNGIDVFEMHPIPVSLKFNIERYGYYGDDVNMWWQIEPQ